MNNLDSLCADLLGIATKATIELEQTIPDDPIFSFIMFVETLRVYDCWAVSVESLSWDGNCTRQLLDLIGLGTNFSTGYLFKKVELQGFPIYESTEESRHFAVNMLYKFGCIRMIRRSVDMIKKGLLLVEKDGNTFVFKKTAVMDAQFLDPMEFSYLEEINKKILENKGKQLEGWNIIDQQQIVDHAFRPGNFFSQQKSDYSQLILNNIDLLMEPLITTMNSGHGILMSYGTTLEIDFHFLAIALMLVKDWVDEAGFHPETKIGTITGANVTAVVTILTSFALKHVEFIKIAEKKYPEINIAMSLTTWTPVEEMIKDIAAFTETDYAVVNEVFDTLKFKPHEVEFLKSHTTKFMPLLIDMENGYVLRPVSAILYNPFFSIIPLLEYRNPNMRHNISLPRESWVRKNLYAMFSGQRYQKIEGNIKLKEGNFTNTDLDAAIFDNLTGELAIFQIKWQDFYYNDVKKLQSRASNLTKDLDEWAAKTTSWIKSHGHEELARNLRLKTNVNYQISNVYLFAISRTKARMKGYGYAGSAENLATCNWPQFSRNRFEIGPAERVFKTLFHALKEQEEKVMLSRPLPVTWNVGDENLRFEDMYNAAE
jgi:hypothetical protein